MYQPISSSPRTMVSGTAAAADNSSTVNSHILSTVVPANMTGDLLREFSGVDLALKLHYLKTVYYFKHSEIIEGLTIFNVKEALFLMLDVYYEAAGRIRRHESTGWPHIKCNDSGVRIIEARCEKALDEWLEMSDVTDRHKHLVYDKVLGPDLFFSPLVYVQLTKFKCGGLAVGVSWAHVLDDPVSESNCMKLWGQLLGTKQPLARSLHKENPEKKITSPVTGNPPSIKKVEPVGDFWLAPTKVHMVTFSFQFNESKLKHLQSKISSQVPTFEAISALIWQSIAKIRTGKEPSLVTIIRNDTSDERQSPLSNKLIITTAATDSTVTKLELSELAMLISNKDKDEKDDIEVVMEKESGKEDYVVYGANLTFVDMQGIELYGLKLKGQKPVYVDYSIHGVGEEGTILVLPGPEEAKEDAGVGSGGRVVTVILPEDEIQELKEVLGSEWSIA